MYLKEKSEINVWNQTTQYNFYSYTAYNNNNESTIPLPFNSSSSKKIGKTRKPSLSMFRQRQLILFCINMSHKLN